MGYCSHCLYFFIHLFFNFGVMLFLPENSKIELHRDITFYVREILLFGEKTQPLILK